MSWNALIAIVCTVKVLVFVVQGHRIHGHRIHQLSVDQSAWMYLNRSDNYVYFLVTNFTFIGAGVWAYYP